MYTMLILRSSWQIVHACTSSKTDYYDRGMHILTFEIREKLFHNYNMIAFTGEVWRRQWPLERSLLSEVWSLRHSAWTWRLCIGVQLEHDSEELQTQYTYTCTYMYVLNYACYLNIVHAYFPQFGNEFHIDLSTLCTIKKLPYIAGIFRGY